MVTGMAEETKVMELDLVLEGTPMVTASALEAAVTQEVTVKEGNALLSVGSVDSFST